MHTVSNIILTKTLGDSSLQKKKKLRFRISFACDQTTCECVVDVLMTPALDTWPQKKKKPLCHSDKTVKEDQLLEKKNDNLEKVFFFFFFLTSTMASEK